MEILKNRHFVGNKGLNFSLLEMGGGWRGGGGEGEEEMEWWGEDACVSAKNTTRLVETDL